MQVEHINSTNCRFELLNVERAPETDFDGKQSVLWPHPHSEQPQTRFTSGSSLIICFMLRMRVRLVLSPTRRAPVSRPRSTATNARRTPMRTEAAGSTASSTSNSGSGNELCTMSTRLAHNPNIANSSSLHRSAQEPLLSTARQ